MEEKVSFEESQIEYPAKIVLKFLTDILKVGFGFGCSIYALYLGFYECREIPALFETKMYYTFISLFLLLNGLDSVVDLITEKKMTYQDYKKCVLISHTCILVLYVPFVTIGFLMADARLATSWEDREMAYTNYELDLW